MSFTIFWNGKSAFLGYKKKKFKKSKNGRFSQGFFFSHGFGSKMAIFPTFFLDNIGQENVFYDIVEQKTPF